MPGQQRPAVTPTPTPRPMVGAPRAEELMSNSDRQHDLGLTPNEGDSVTMFGEYNDGDYGPGGQFYLGAERDRDGASLSAEAHAQVGTQGAHLRMAAGGSVDVGSGEVGAEFEFEGGFVARVERDGDHAFVVVGRNAKGSVTAEVGWSIAQAKGGFGVGGEAELRRPLEGSGAEQVIETLLPGESASVFGFDGALFQATQMMLELDFVSETDAGEDLAPGERLSLSDEFEIEAGIGLEGGASVGAEGKRISRRTVTVERTERDVVVQLDLAEEEALEGAIGVGVEAQVRGGASEMVSIVARLDPDSPQYSDQYAQLLAVEGHRDAVSLRDSGLLPSNTEVHVLTTAAAGVSTVVDLKHVEVGLHRGSFGERREVVAADGSTRTELAAGHMNGVSARFGTWELAPEELDAMRAVIVDGEVVSVTLGYGDGVGIELTVEDVAELSARMADDRAWKWALSAGAEHRLAPDGDFMAAWNALPALLAGREPARLARGLHTFLFAYPEMGLPALRRFLSGRDAFAEGEIGTYSQWPAGSEAAAYDYSVLEERMRTIDESPPDAMEAARLFTQVDEMDWIVSDLEFTEPQARIDMLEQLFVWRAQVQRYMPCEDAPVTEASPVQLAESATLAMKQHVEMLIENDTQEEAVLRDAYAMWLEERAELRIAYDRAGIDPALWRCSPRSAGQTRELDISLSALESHADRIGTVLDLASWRL